MEADLGICGTPCHPYSTQRAERFKSGSVDSHKEYDVAMEDFFGWFEAFQPRALIFEQVMGLNLPFEAGGQETPLSRFLVQKTQNEVYKSKYMYGKTLHLHLEFRINLEY